MSFALTQVWWVALLPGLAAVIIALFTRQQRQISAALALASTGLSFLMSLAIMSAAFTGGQSALSTTFGAYRWTTVGSQSLYVAWGLTPLSALMLVVVTLVSGLVQVYSLAYMKDEAPRAFSRYYGALALFTFSMLALVIADNLLMIFAGWELVGVSSFLLIGFWFKKPAAAKAANKAFLVNRIGDLGMLVGILLLYSYTHELGFGANVQAIAKGVIPATTLGVIMFLLFWGPIGKSAQVPLHVWLPDAMEGPTPVSALIHAATMVAAGVYFVGRLFEMFVLAPAMVLNIVAGVGALTAVLAAAIALVQTDIKKVLAYSTVSQLGFMMLALGMGPVGYKAGLFHLFTHAFFKALLFLGAGSVIHAVHTQDIREMGGLKAAMPLTRITFLIGTLSITGLPFLTAGFWSKEAIFHATWAHNPGIFALAVVAATMTAFYMFRLYFLTFEGSYRGHAHPHESPTLMTAPLLILAVPSIAAGWLDTGMFGHAIDRFLAYGGVGAEQVHATAGMDWPLVALSAAIFAVGTGLAYAIYIRKTVDAAGWAKDWPGLHDMLSHKFYIDEAYATFVDRVVLGWASVAAMLDRYVVDGLVNGIAMGTVAGGEGLKLLQTGRVQTYALIATTSLFVIVWILTRI
ncbi:MAG: NADH-quinone oxidoreductase subunit L [Candidatus Sericytochromatia bacterium]|nr:NADH-quinone oxidoreductase subunit L [Candidatus Sericytochromatia bacterium]